MRTSSAGYPTVIARAGATKANRRKKNGAEKEQGCWMGCRTHNLLNHDLEQERVDSASGPCTIRRAQDPDSRPSRQRLSVLGGVVREAGTRLLGD